ncbi:hypothetical protein WS87_00015 (plasmid) [Burkholderia sp. MSMB0856]|uniref:hypothetical protein n=1 Tax=Burkholderia sp. MSMB0856 TaxID=1637869 RepID=UPI000855DD85|nr:hypothetical protein [Burkholderia sp. MSMB0856]AOJ85188.1 hypothetical protein WS87_00015 [Burkholderia sp. MSMB0856]
MTPKTEWDTTRKLPFWLRRIDVPVDGQTAAQQQVEFNWWLVFAPLYALGAGLVVMVVVAGIAMLVGFTVSMVKAFPVVSGILLLVLLFKRQR